MNNNYYTTSDTQWAAFLLLNDARLVSTSYCEEDKRCYFNFDCIPDYKLNRLMSEWLSAESLPLKKILNKHRFLKRKIKEKLFDSTILQNLDV